MGSLHLQLHLCSYNLDLKAPLCPQLTLAAGGIWSQWGGLCWVCCVHSSRTFLRGSSSSLGGCCTSNSPSGIPAAAPRECPGTMLTVQGAGSNPPDPMLPAPATTAHPQAKPAVYSALPPGWARPHTAPVPWAGGERMQRTWQRPPGTRPPPALG